MRIAPALLVLLASSSAYADRGSGASFDFGYVRSKVAVSDATALDANQARFGIRISVGKNFHFGGEVDDGVVEGHTSLPNRSVARTTGGESYSGPLGGNSLGLKAYAGLHSIRGNFMFGGDAALGVRDTWVESDAGMDVAGYKKEPMIELRARAEYFLTDSMALGAMATTDMLEKRNVSLALMFSLNFMD